MLLAIRDRAKGWIAYFIIGLIAIPFAFFGVYNYLSGPSNNIAAKVNDVEISVNEVNNVYRQQRQQLQAMFGDQFDPDLFDDRQLRRDALDQLINEVVLAEYVRSQGFRVSDAQLAQVIRAQEVFHENGRFSSSRYQQLLQANMMSPEMYESRMRQAQVLEQLQEGVFASALVTDADVERLIRIERQQRDFGYLAVSRAAFEDPAAVEAADMQQFYDDNPQLFQRPEEVRLQYLELTEQALREQVDVDEEQLRRRYEEQRESRFTELGERQVRHILLELPQQARSEEVEAARERLLELREEIVAGASFEELAREHSDDPGSAAVGGDLGVIQRGMMVEAFEEAAFELAEGELSEPVRTPFGLHLIQVSHLEEGRVQPFEEVRDELEQELVMERVGNRMFQLVETLGNLTYEEPETLEPAAAELGLEVQETDWFSRDGGEGVAAEPRVVQAAFSQEVLDRGYNSEPVNLGDRHLVVRVAEHRPATRLPLEEVADQVRQAVAREQAEQRTAELAAALREQVAAGEELNALAEQEGVSYRAVEDQRRVGGELPRALVERVFALPRPDGEAAAPVQVRLQGGDYAVVQLRAVRDGDPAELDAEEQRQYRHLLQQAYGESALRDLIETLREEANVRIYENRL